MIRVLLVDEDNPDNTATVLRSREWVKDLIACTEDSCMLSSLPTDEGLDPDTCYRLNVKVTG